MNFKFCFLLLSFLIISCDLPNEADLDCNGDKAGVAYIDDCGRCVDGNTGYSFNQDIDLCDECFGDNACLDGVCNDQNAINFRTVPEGAIADNTLCIYDMCTDYLPNALSSNQYDCDTSSSNGLLYDVGDKLRCEDVERVYSISYPENCSNSFKLSDFFGKAIYILIESSWWDSCFQKLSSFDDFVQSYLVDNQSDLILLTFFYDEYQPYSCSQWGLEGDDRLPIIINDGAANGGGGNNGLDRLFFNEGGVAPQHVFINKELELHFKQSGALSEAFVISKISEMLE